MASYFFFPILGWSNDAFYLVQIVKVWHSMLENPFLEALLLVKHAVHAQLCAYVSLTEKINCWVALPLLKLLYLLGVILKRVFCLRLPIFLLWSVKSHQVWLKWQVLLQFSEVWVKVPVLPYAGEGIGKTGEWKQAVVMIASLLPPQSSCTGAWRLWLFCICHKIFRLLEGRKKYETWRAQRVTQFSFLLQFDYLVVRAAQSWSQSWLKSETWGTGMAKWSVTSLLGGRNTDGACNACLMNASYMFSCTLTRLILFHCWAEKDDVPGAHCSVW